MQPRGEGLDSFTLILGGCMTKKFEKHCDIDYKVLFTLPTVK